jgi:predicted GNAT family acetyltransferase
MSLPASPHTASGRGSSRSCTPRSSRGSKVRGVGGTLVAGALDDARARDLAVLPFCPFVNSYIDRHPELVPLVPEEYRAQFGL